MLTELISDPFLWMSHHQWGDLLAGILGAISSGLIAVWVLRRTLKTQRNQFRAHLTAQSEGLDAQLKAQAEAFGSWLPSRWPLGAVSATGGAHVQGARTSGPR
ncbi:hypothetical protein GCM10017710_07000 [Arthrobacter ramosus]